MSGYSIPHTSVGRQSEETQQIVAHCATPFLTQTGAWIHQQIAQLRRWRPIVFTQEAANQAQFPVETLIDAGQWPIPRRLVNRVVRRWSGEYPFYGDLMRQRGVRLIHAHFGYQGCRCLRAQRQTGLPLITTFYGADATSFARQPAWRRRYVELFERGALFLVEGSAMGRQLVELGCPEDRIRVQHLGVDTSRIEFTPRQPSAHPHILMCGSFREKKGFDDGLRAIGRALARLDDSRLGVSGPQVQITLVGEGPERPQIEAAIQDSGLEGRVRMPGMLPYQQVIELLSKCDLLLQPSRIAADGDSEGGAPVIMLDAQAAGVPVVATRHADIPEYVVDGVSGLLADERDVEGLTLQIEALLREPERWAAMGRAGRDHVESDYDAGKQCLRLEEIYDAVAAGREVGKTSLARESSGPANS
ncbi:MAG: glycosyltransferase [Candidatus Latescibacterota bacterium]|nr:glycosyltransferase [Candidatus Latescibacterota bacterium]